jgi:cytidylate kinase
MLFNDLPKVGFIGLSRSGKGLAAEVLVKKLNFASVTLSDVIREYAKENGIELKTRDDFRETGNEIQSKFGLDYLLKRALQKLEEQYIASNGKIKGLVFEGMRRMHVVRGFKSLPNSKLIYITALADIRFERQREFRAEDSAKTLAEFIKN